MEIKTASLADSPSKSMNVSRTGFFRDNLRNRKISIHLRSQSNLKYINKECDTNVDDNNSDNNDHIENE